jgi:hypothetical protein
MGFNGFAVALWSVCSGFLMVFLQVVLLCF